MTKRRRRHKRLIKKLLAVVTKGDKSLRGLTVRLSETGFFVRTQRAFREGTEVTVLLTLPDGVPCELKGTVKFARRMGLFPRQNGMGIEITDACYEYKELVSSLKRPC